MQLIFITHRQTGIATSHTISLNLDTQESDEDIWLESCVIYMMHELNWSE